MTTTTTRCLLNDNVCLNSGLCLLNDTDGMGPLGLSRPQRGRGEGKGAEGQSPFRYLCESEQGRRGSTTCLFSAFGYGAVEESGGRNRTLSSSVRLTRAAAKKQRLRKETKQAGEESLLK